MRLPSLSAAVLALLCAGALSLSGLSACGEAAAPPPPGQDPERPERDVTPPPGEDTDPADTDPADTAEDSDEEDVPRPPCGGPCPDDLVCQVERDRCELPTCATAPGRCVGETVVRLCNEEGTELLPAAECSTLIACEGSSCLCFQGACYQREPCAPGSRRCRDEAVQTCAPTGQFYQVTRRCNADLGQTCIGGECRCPGNQQLCEDACVNLAEDRDNCGRCGNVCDPSLRCVGGSCACPSGLQRCDGACVNTFEDPNNCGSCGIVCEAGQACVSGRCDCPSNLTPCAGGCADLQRDPRNCNACGFRCPDGADCVNGACVCTGNRTLCGDACVDLQTNTRNCGTCFVGCGSAESCINGTCRCPDGQLNCGGVCVDIRNNNSHCGNCDRVCRGDCVNGICQQGCQCTPFVEVYCRPGQGACPGTASGCCTIAANGSCADPLGSGLVTPCP